MGLIRSFAYAFRGIRIGLFSDRNITIQSIAAVLAISASFILEIGIAKTAVVIFISAVVLSLELINTALERYIDKLTPEKSDVVRDVKDIFAGSVLLMSIASVIIAILFFLPPLLNRIGIIILF